MNRACVGLAILGCLVPVSLRAGKGPVPLFDSRVAYEPLLDKLMAAGGNPAAILHPRSVADLLRLTPNARYKFALKAGGDLAVAPSPEDFPGNEYTHPVLGAGEAVHTAGGIRVDHDGTRLRKITVDPDSKAYCPTADSLRSVLDALVTMGAAPGILRVENRPCDCIQTGSSPPPEGGPRYGALMQEVGRRFETLGRASESGRWDLALFQLEELGEVFEEDLPRAVEPKEKTTADLKGLAKAFQETHLPELETALKARDPRALRAAFTRAATTCNGCHQASGHVFIEIPGEPGKPVPLVDTRPSPASSPPAPGPSAR